MSRRGIWVIALISVFVLGAAIGGGGALAFRAAHPSLVRHDHATFKVFVDGRALHFSDPSFDIKSTQFVAAHMHTGDNATIHLETSTDTPFANMTLGRFFEAHHMALGEGHLRLAPADGGREFVDNATSSLRFFVRPYGGEFAARSEWGAYHVLPCDRLLVSWGPRDASLSSELAAVPSAESGTTYPACR